MKAGRRQAIDQYRQRTPARGAYAIRCVPTGRAWVGAATDLRAVENRERFLLRQGDHRDRTLQADWRAHGEVAFRFEVLETLGEDVAAVLVPELLRETRRLWAERLGASVLL